MEVISVKSTLTSVDDMVKVLAGIIETGAIDNNIRVLAVSLADSSSLSGLNNNNTNIIELNPAAAISIFDYVLNNIKYVPDIDGIETFQTPDVTLKNKFGDCDDMTSLLGALYRSIGFTYALVMVQMPGFTTYNHVYGAVYTTEGWKYVDSSNKESGSFDFDYPAEDIIKRKVIIIGSKVDGDQFFNNPKTEISYYNVPGTNMIKPYLPLIGLGVVLTGVYLYNKYK